MYQSGRNCTGGGISKRSDKWSCKGKVSEVVKKSKNRQICGAQKDQFKNKCPRSGQNIVLWVIACLMKCLHCSHRSNNLVAAALVKEKCLWLKLGQRYFNHFHRNLTNMCQNLAGRGRCERCDRRSCQRILLKYFMVWRRQWDGGLKNLRRGVTGGEMG